jgi:hypothetical protein
MLRSNKSSKTSLPDTDARQALFKGITDLGIRQVFV